MASDAQLPSKTNHGLLPCPFCGDSQLGQMQMTSFDETPPRKWMRVKCETCGAMAPDTAWNQRHSGETSDQRCSACGHVELFKGAKVLKWPDLGGGTLEAVSSDVLGMRMAVEASAALERTKRRAIDCPHERASIKCPDCGIDLVAHKDGGS